MIICIIFFFFLGLTPIMSAAFVDNINLVQYLISHGAEADQTDYFGKNILFHASDPKFSELFPYLINKQDCNGKYTIIHFFTVFGF